MSGYDYIDRDGYAMEAGPEMGPTPRPGRFHPSHSTLHRMRLGAQRLGCTLAEYLAQRGAGNSWCSYHRAWEPVGLFGSQMKRGRRVLNSKCKAGAAERQREYLERKRAQG